MTKTKKNDTCIYFKLSSEDKELFQLYAADNDMTLSQLIRKAIKYYIDYHVD